MGIDLLDILSLGRPYTLDAGSSCPLPPAAPLLAVADLGNGEGALATISGSSDDATNELRVQKMSCCQTLGDWTSGGSRSEDGNVSLALTLGRYLAVAISTTGAGTQISNLVSFTVTDEEDLVLEPAPTGVLSVPLVKLISAVAGLPSWLQKTQTETRRESVKRIHWPVLEVPDIREYMPCAVIGFAGSFSLTKIAGGDRNYLQPEFGALRLELFDVAAGDDGRGDLEACLQEFTNWVGCLLADLAEVAGKSSMLATTKIDQEVEPTFCSEQEAGGGLYCMASYLITWE